MGADPKDFPNPFNLPINVKPIVLPAVDPAPIPGRLPTLLARIQHNTAKSDLNDADPPTPALTPAETNALDLYSGLGMLTGAPYYNPSRWETDMRAELKTVAGAIGDDFCTRFKNNQHAGATVSFPHGSAVNGKVVKMPGYQTEHARIAGKLDAQVKQHAAAPLNAGSGAFQFDWFFVTAKTPAKSSDGRDALINKYCVDWPMEFGVSVPTAPLLNPFASDEENQKVADALTLKGVIGSFQGSEVWLKSLTVDKAAGTYQGVIEYVLVDHFGVDNSDVLPSMSLHGTPGQCGMWLLQHKVRQGYKPFVTEIHINEAVSGKLR